MEFTRLFDIPIYQLRAHPKVDALTGLRGPGFVQYSSAEVMDLVDRTSAGLLAAGVDAGDRIGIVSENRPEWNIVDFAIQQIGAITVPIDPRVNERDRAHIFNDARLRFVFVSGEELYLPLRELQRRAPSLAAIYTFDRVDGGTCWQDILPGPEKANARRLEEIRSTIDEEDVATIVYTSGTTGLPKGVMLSHRNVISNIKSCFTLLPVDERHRALSFLPLAHMFERMLTYLYMTRGVSIYYAESISTIADNLGQVRPQVFTTVPKLLEKTYEKILEKGEALSGVGRRLFTWALRLAERYELHGKSPGYRLQLALARRLVFRRWREAMGGNLLLTISGGATLSPRLARIFTAAGIPVLEGYGLTETSPVVAVNRVERAGRKFGTVGRVVDGVRLKIAADGELLVSGPNVMKGYYRKRETLWEKACLHLPGRDRFRTKCLVNRPPRASCSDDAEAFDGSGWFRTGDIGVLDEEGFLRIVDRKKAMFKTSGGEYVAPQRVEDILKQDSLIEDAIVIGAGEKSVAALISPAFDRLERWCAGAGVPWTSKAEMIQHGRVREKYGEILEARNRLLGRGERVRRFELIAERWSTETGELTTTLKLRRAAVAGKYNDLIAQMFSNATAA